MKPENRLYSHVKRREEIVPAADMAQLVREKGFQLFGAQALQQKRRQNQYRPQKADDSRLVSARADECRHSDRELHRRARS
jgi:hypothetical protein